MSDHLTSNQDLAAALAHRVCCGVEHDPANGKLHGYCVVCGVPWPCDTAKYFLRPAEPPDASPSLEGIENTIIWLELAVKCANFKWDEDQKAAAEEAYLQAKGEVWALKKRCANPVPSCTHPVLVDSVEQPGKDIYTCPRCNVEVRIFHSEIRPRAASTKNEGPACSAVPAQEVASQDVTASASRKSVESDLAPPSVETSDG